MATRRDRTPADKSNSVRTELTSQAPDDATSCQPSRDDIAREAYARFCARGQAHGHDIDDWIESERALRARGDTEIDSDRAISRLQIAEV